LPLVDSTPRAYRLRAGNAASPSSTSAGTSPDYLARDVEGIEAANLEAARVEALAAAREVLGDAIKAGQGQDNRQYEITDEAGQVLAVVPLTDALTP
jgi:hypothetical protein